MSIYEECPKFENDNYLLRFVEEKDATDLLEVYSDKNALPFFNSDNCNGDNFYYSTKERMMDAIRMWKTSYEKKWFVRWTIVDKTSSRAIGTIELFHRDSDDNFDGSGVLRLDVRSDYERENQLFDIMSLIISPAFELFECNQIITKAPIYAIERIQAIKRIGFVKSEYCMVGMHDRYAYNGYWALGEKQSLSTP